LDGDLMVGVSVGVVVLVAGELFRLMAADAADADADDGVYGR
jgi:hypothetical protein